MNTLPLLARRLVLPAVLLLAAPAARAQKGLVTLEAGYGLASANWGSFSQFLDTYNAVNKNDALQPLALDGLSTWSIRACGLGFMTLGYDQLRGNLSTGFKSGGERHINLRQNLLTVAVEPSLQGKQFFAGLIGGFGFGTTRVDCPFVYSDGTESYGAESELNGVYRATVMTPFFGAKVGGSYKNLALTLRVEKFVAGAITHDFDLSDQTVYNLPTDYARYVQRGAALYGVDDVVVGDLSSLRFQLQLGYMLKPLSDD